MALQWFRAQQSGNAFWQNETYDAMNRMFSGVFKKENMIGWFMAHEMDYGVYLELANDGVHAAIRPTINNFFWKFYKKARLIYNK
jgi:hypothetical protein